MAGPWGKEECLSPRVGLESHGDDQHAKDAEVARVKPVGLSRHGQSVTVGYMTCHRRVLSCVSLWSPLAARMLVSGSNSCLSALYRSRPTCAITLVRSSLARCLSQRDIQVAHRFLGTLLLASGSWFQLSLMHPCHALARSCTAADAHLGTPAYARREIYLFRPPKYPGGPLKM